MIQPEMSLKQILLIRKKNPKPHQSTYTASRTIKLWLKTSPKLSTKKPETYFTKTRSNNTVRISALSPETYRKLIRHIQDEKIIHYTYEIKQDRAYRVVIRDLRHSISTNEIKNELNEKGHLVRNIINVKNRATKEPLHSSM
jgi:hypothetical protein